MGLILVTDDNQTCRDSIQKTLEREGHRVEGAADADAALEALSLRDFDLVVCDYRMPRKTGLELLAELRHRGSEVPFLMISGYADASTEFAARQLGAASLLRKPFRRRQLVDSAESLIEHGPEPHHDSP
jgi:DNA-binding NtrC family response regulator